MFSLFLTPPYAPFAFAFMLMIGIGLVEAVGLGSGHLDLDADSDVGHGGFLDWLGLGELPILVWLTSLLGCFTLVGIAIQQIATGLLGSPISPFIAGGTALLGGGALNTFAANGLARILPGYESTVVSSDDLLRSRGTILEGSARRGHPARAKVVDRHGQAHYVMVEPHADDCVIAKGETALLVRRDGSLFFALPDASVLQPL